MTHTIHTDAEARLAGYTRLVYAECDMNDGVYLISPDLDIDLDAVVLAWDTDLRRFVKLNGWLWSFEDVQEEAI